MKTVFLQVLTTRIHILMTMLLSLFLQIAASGQQLDNTGETAASVIDVNNIFSRAITFVAGTTISNDNITVNLSMYYADTRGGLNHDFTVQIWGDNGGSPDAGNIIATLSGNSNPRTTGIYAYTGSVSWTAGTTYHIVMSAPTTSGSYMLRNTTSTTITTSNGYTSNHEYQYFFFGNWFPASNSALIFSLSVTSLLPVELTYFTAQSEEAFVTLNWQTV